MTLGFGAAAWTEEGERMVAIAADTRISFGYEHGTDAGVKTYELGGRSAMVASGHALPPMMAAELTRSLVDNHNRRSPERKISFFDTVRLTSFFLKRAADEQGASCRVAAVGFLEGGAPCIASIIVSPGFNRAAFHKIEKGGTSAMPVGDEAGSRLVLEAMAEAKRQKRPTITAANQRTLLYFTPQGRISHHRRRHFRWYLHVRIRKLFMAHHRDKWHEISPWNGCYGRVSTWLAKPRGNLL